MARHVAQLFPHLRFRIWGFLAVVAIIASVLVVAPAPSGAQPAVDVVTTDTTITLSWEVEGQVSFFWWQPEIQRQEIVNVADAKSYTITGLTPGSKHVFSFFGALSGKIEVTAKAADTAAPPPDTAPPPPDTQQASEQSIAHCFSDSLVETVRGYYEANKNKPPTHGENWKRVLIAFGEVQDENLTPFTAAEARAGEQRWLGWRPVREAIECIETANPPPPPSPEISITSGADVTEGANASFTVTATPPPSAGLDVSVTVTQGGSFTTQTGTRTVTITTTGTASFTITTDDDSADEFDGSITATVDAGTGYTVSSSAGSAAVAVADNDPAAQPGQTNNQPTVSIADASSNEGDDVDFVVSVSPVQSSAIALDYHTADGTAIAHSDVDDYTAASGQVTIPAGSSSATITISTTEDSDIEIDDEFTVTISNPPAGVTISDDTATGTIRNDDTGTRGSAYRDNYKYIVLNLAQSSWLSVWEDGGEKTWKFHLNKKPPHAITVRPVVQGARNARSLDISPDYLVFTPSNWNQHQTISVLHLGDWGSHLGTAHVSLDFVEYPGFEAISDLSVKMYGVNRSNPITQRKPDPNLLMEGDPASSLTYQLKLGRIPRNPVTVSITNPDPGAVTVTPTSLVFNHENYDEFQDVTITPVADSDHDDEDVEITVTIPVPHPVDAQVTSRALTETFRVAVEEPPTPSVRVAPKSLTFDEGTTAKYDVWVRTDPGNGKSVIVTPTFTGSDVTVSPTTLTFTGGSTGNWQTRQRVTVTAAQDPDKDHENVTISHVISGDGNGYSAQSPSQSVAVDVLDDEAKVEIEFDRTVFKSDGNVVLDEGNTSGVDMRVRLTHDPGPAGGANGQVVITNFRSAGKELVVDPPTLTFTTGPTGNWNDWQTLTIKPPSGNEDDGNTRHDRHRIELQLGAAPYKLQNLPGYPDTTDDLVVRAINVFYFDDEIANDLHLEHTSLTLHEGGSAATYELALGGDAGGPVTVTITNPDPAKLTVSPTTVTFPYGGKGDWHTAEVTLTALQDADPLDETLQVVHDYNGYTNTQQTLTVNIDDDEELAMTLPASTVALDELSSTTYDVYLSTDPGDGRSVVITPVSGDTDRLTVSGPLTFTGGSSGNWNSAQTVTLNAPLDDNYVKDTVTITHTISGFAGVSAPSVTATIADAKPVYVTWTSDPAGEKIAPNSTLNLTEGTPGEVYVHFDPALLIEGKFKDDWFDRMAKGNEGLTVGDGGPTIYVRVPGSISSFFAARSAGENCDGRYPRPRSTNAKYCDTVPVKSDIDADTNDETRRMEFHVGSLPALSYAAPRRLTVKIEDTSISMQAWPSALFPIEDVAATQDVWVRLKQKPEPGVTVTIQPEIKSADSTKVSATPSSLTFDASDWDTFQKFTVTASSDVDTANEDISFKLKGTASDSKVVVLDAKIGVTVLDDD